MIYFALWVVFLVVVLLAIPVTQLIEKRRDAARFAAESEPALGDEDEEESESAAELSPDAEFAAVEDGTGAGDHDAGEALAGEELAGEEIGGEEIGGEEEFAEIDAVDDFGDFDELK